MLLLLVVVLVASATPAAALGAPPKPDPVVWTSLLPESNTTVVNTMPIGNGVVAANAFVDNTTTPGHPRIGLLIASQEAWSEAGELIKVAWVFVTPSRAPSDATFSQTLDPATATFTAVLGDMIFSAYFDGGHVAAAGPQTPSTNYLQISARTSGAPFSVSVSIQPIRTAPTSVTPAFDCGAYTVSPDTAVALGRPDAVAVLHTNTYANASASFTRLTLARENIPCSAVATDPITGRMTGLVVFGSTLHTTSTAYELVSSPATSVTIGAAVITSWAGGDFAALAKAAVAAGVPPPSAHQAWWAQFWARSWLVVSTSTLVTSKYVLQRYITALQTRAPFPVKFNGMLFTANRPPNEDTRQWGGLNWWQNLRLPYYPLLQSGDGDLLEPFFDGFLATLPIAQTRTATYFPYMDPATRPAFFPEYTHPLLSTTHPGSYGCNRPASEPAWYSEDRWNHYNHQGALDLSLFMLDHFAYTQDQARLRQDLPLMLSVVQFYRQRFNKTDAAGKRVFWPTQSIETWQCPGYPPPAPGADCPANDMPTVAGLRAVLPRLLALPSGFLSADEQKVLSAFQAVLPDIPLNGTAADPTTKLMPCAICPSHTSNRENADLYAVHPYRLFTTANNVSLHLAANAFATRQFVKDIGWNQNAMDAALLGMAAEAQTLVLARAVFPPATGYRFPVFAPHFQDYEPSADHYGVFASALSWMLLQPRSDAAHSMVLLPAWPCSWDVDFQLHDPLNTVVTGSLAKGRLEYTVSPASRHSDVEVRQCQK